MQLLFVLLRITIFEKGFPSLLPPTKTSFSAKYHMYQNEKFTTSPDAQPMTKFHICPKIKSTPLPAKPAERPYPASPGQRSPYSGRFPYPARLNRKFRHPASPAKGFRILPQAGKFPYFDLFPRPRILIPHRPTEHLYSTLPVRKFRHPASPAKGFRILPRPNRFPYSAPAQNFRIAKKHPHPLRMEVFRLFKLPITQQQKYLLQLCIRPCVPTGCVFP